MCAALCFPDVYYVPGFPLNNNLGLYRMTLFLARIPVFLVFFGLFTGLSITSTTMYSMADVLFFSAFFIGQTEGFILG